MLLDWFGLVFFVRVFAPSVQQILSLCLYIVPSKCFCISCYSRRREIFLIPFEVQIIFNSIDSTILTKSYYVNLPSCNNVARKLTKYCLQNQKGHY